MKKIITTIVCEILGHSNILKGDFGWMYCGRCNVFLGDSLGGAYTNLRAVIIGHKCRHCKKNLKKLTWKDKLLVKYSL